MSVKWQKVKLGDVCQAINTGPFGSQLHQHDYSASGTPVVMPKDIVDGKVSEDGIARVSDEHIKRLSRHQVVAGDLLFSRRGDVGRCALIGQRENGWLCGTGCLRVQLDVEKVFPPFVFRSMCLSESVKWLEGHAVGSTMPNINASILSDVPVSFPPLPVQKKIASILSAYDDLIENNRRRIAILEEMARKVYRKRFGGKKANGTIAELASANDECYKAGNLPSEINYVDIASVSTGRIDGKTRLSASEAPGRARRIARNGDVIWSNVRPNLKAYALVLSPDADDVFSTGFTVLRARNNWYSYLYMAVTQDKFVSYLEGCVSGATYPAVRPDDFLRAETYVPSEDEGVSFQQQTETIYNQMQTLVDANRKLAAARDALLPKLMSGRIDVDGLEVG